MNKDSMVVRLNGGPTPPPPPPTPPAPPRQPGPRRRRSNNGWVGIVAFLILLAGCWFAYSYFTSGPEDEAGTPAITNIEEEAPESIVEKVGKHIVLPEDEEPTIATVSDPSKLQEQAFFANAKVGHVVLIYAIAKKAYLYDPSIDKLIEVAPISQ